MKNKYWYLAVYKDKFENFDRAREIVFRFAHDIDFEYPEKKFFRDCFSQGPLRGALLYLEELARKQGLENPEILRIQALGEISECGDFISRSGYVPDHWKPETNPARKEVEIAND